MGIKEDLAIVKKMMLEQSIHRTWEPPEVFCTALQAIAMLKLGCGRDGSLRFIIAASDKHIVDEFLESLCEKRPLIEEVHHVS